MSISPSVKVQQSSDPLQLIVPGSKSVANRYLILASLRPESVTLKNIPRSDDVVSMIECLRKLDIYIEEEGSDIIVHRQFPKCLNKDVELHPNEGGTTIRFLLGLCSLSAQEITIHLPEVFQPRPLNAFLDAFQQLDIECTFMTSKVVVKGGVKKGSVKVDRSLSSQFYSAFLLAYSHTEIEIDAVGEVSSEGYIKRTQACLEGIKKSSTIEIERDYSSLGYLWAWNFLCQGVVPPSVDSLQPDSQLCDILANWEKTNDFDCRDYPDLIPTIIFLSSYLKGKRTFRNCQLLKAKESNRFEEMKTILSLFKIPFKSTDTELVVQGTSWRLDTEIHYKAPRDHRMAMVAALFMRYNRGGQIEGADCVSKSFPEFFERLNGN
jgi:3-phosphoshikimate 1-carboxyvinyltransferase